ncbi:MAG: ParB/RepB/Spo0J family partition protein [Rickettsiales bacterium]|nr:ParB/RepB/Spo0J family partition protein [Rickettsiales bacterium]
MQPEKKLGRGLSALLGESKSKKTEIVQNPNVKAGDVVEMIAINKIIAGIYQPRKNFNHDEIDELANSIKENGLIQPIILRKADEKDHYEIIAGERRFRASKIAGLAKIPSIIRKINNHEALELAIIENVQRSDLSVIEEATGYKQLIEEFSYSQEQVAKRVGKSRSHITNLLRLLTLPQMTRELLDKKLISMGHAKVIINSNDPEKLSQKIVDESLSVRNVEDLVRDEKVEKIKNNTLLVRTESKIKFVNTAQLTKIENELSELLKMEAKISYNSLKNKGKITIKFSEIEEIQQLIENIKNGK